MSEVLFEDVHIDRVCASCSSKLDSETYRCKSCGRSTRKLPRTINDLAYPPNHFSRQKRKRISANLGVQKQIKSHSKKLLSITSMKFEGGGQISSNDVSALAHTLPPSHQSKDSSIKPDVVIDQQHFSSIIKQERKGEIFVHSISRNGSKPQANPSQHCSLSLLDSFNADQLQAHIASLKAESFHRRYRPIIQKLVDNPLNSGIFNAPVQPLELGIPDYFHVVKHPMDLGTVRQKLDAGRYRSLEQLQADVVLVFDNALTYNPSLNPIHSAATKLKEEFISDLLRLNSKIDGDGKKREEHSCQFCQGHRCTICNEKCQKFDPPILTCDCCMERLKRGEVYYRSHLGHRWCFDCVNDGGMKAEPGAALPPTSLVTSLKYVHISPEVGKSLVEYIVSSQTASIGNNSPKNKLKHAKIQPSKPPISLPPVLVTAALQLGPMFASATGPLLYDAMISAKYDPNVVNAIRSAGISMSSRALGASDTKHASGMKDKLQVSQGDYSNFSEVGFVPGLILGPNRSPAAILAAALRARLEKRRNDDVVAEPWVQCDSCKNWVHQICAMFNGRKNALLPFNADYICAICRLNQLQSGDRSEILDSPSSKMLKDSMLLPIRVAVPVMTVPATPSETSASFIKTRRSKIVDAPSSSSIQVSTPPLSPSFKSVSIDYEGADISASADALGVGRADVNNLSDLEASDEDYFSSSARFANASALPRTPLSDELERRVRDRLRSSTSGKIADSIVVRMVSSLKKTAVVPPEVREVFTSSPPSPEILINTIANASVFAPSSSFTASNDNPTPSATKKRGQQYADSYPYRQRVILLWQRLDGIDVCLFALYVQEYGPDAPPPNTNKVYIAYLDSVRYLRPLFTRTAIYHELLAAYLSNARQRGFCGAHIWACPPQRGDGYIFHCHPPSQRVPSKERLREWYDDMLQQLHEEGIVGGISNAFDSYFEVSPSVPPASQSSTFLPRKFSTKRDPSVSGDDVEVSPKESSLLIRLRDDAGLPPYFAGDFWGIEMEKLIRELHKRMLNKAIDEDRRKQKELLVPLNSTSSVSTLSEDREADEVSLSTPVPVYVLEHLKTDIKRRKNQAANISSREKSDVKPNVQIPLSKPLDENSGTSGDKLSRNQNIIQTYVKNHITTAHIVYGSPLGLSGILQPTGYGTIKLGDYNAPVHPLAQVALRLRELSDEFIVVELTPLKVSSGKSKTSKQSHLSSSDSTLSDEDEALAPVSGGDENEDNDEQVTFSASVGDENKDEDINAVMKDSPSHRVIQNKSVRISFASQASGRKKSSKNSEILPREYEKHHSALSFKRVVSNSSGTSNKSKASGLSSSSVASDSNTGSSFVNASKLSHAIAQADKESDEQISGDFFDTRHGFLRMCQGNNYQFDTLRRAKHSSMMILFHLQNPMIPAYAVLCNLCEGDIGAGMRWHCDSCIDFDVCQACKERHGHVHPLVVILPGIKN
jgi:Histone acetylation protein/Bromodomain/Zinc finger, ZZ type